MGVSGDCHHVALVPQSSHVIEHGVSCGSKKPRVKFIRLSAGVVSDLDVTAIWHGDEPRAASGRIVRGAFLPSSVSAHFVFPGVV
jgi:hypothetical protein